MTPARPPKTPTTTVPNGTLATLMALLLEAEGAEAEGEGAVVVGLAEPALEDPPPETVKGEVNNSDFGEEE
jgi:hypothetical protein